MKKILLILAFASCINSPIAYSMQLPLGRSGLRALLSTCSRTTMEPCHMDFAQRAASSTVACEFMESIRQRKGKMVPRDFFKTSTSLRTILQTIKSEIYETREWPHVDPTPGNAGYCQLIAAFMADQIHRLSNLDFDRYSDDEGRALLPLVKAFVIQEKYDPKNYQPLNPKLVLQKLRTDLDFLAEDCSLSNNQANILLRRTQESFMEDLFEFTKTHDDTPIEESMEVAMDKIHESDCYVYTRYYRGTPDRADIFSVVSLPSGDLYRQMDSASGKWARLSGHEVAALINSDDRRNIIQVHFESQPEINDCSHLWGLDEKPEIKRILERNRKAGHINSTPDFYGFGDSVFDLREFVMRGVRAINDPGLRFQDPEHPVTVPCHFSVVPGVRNLAKLASYSVFEDDEGPCISRSYASRDNFINSPLLIRRFVGHWKNRSPENSMTWVLEKRFKGFDAELGLAYDCANESIDPKYSFFIARKIVDGKTEVIRDRDRRAEIYHEFMTKSVRPLTNPTYLYPQARFLLQQARVFEKTVNDMLDPSFTTLLFDDL